MTRRRRRVRPGSQMLAVLRYVASNPGCSRREAAEALSPDRPSSVYKAVQSCGQRGLLHVSLPPSTGESTPPKTTQAVLFLTVAGEAVLAEEP